MGDLSLLKKDCLFSGATCPHTHTVYFHGRPALKLTLVYFHGRPTHTCSSWSIFTGDLPTNVHPGLSSWATCPSTHTDLFSRATYPHMLILVYFQGRPAHMVYFHGRPALPLTLIYFHGRPTHTCSSWSIFRGDRPTPSHWSIFRGDLPTLHPGLFSGVTCPHMFIVVYFHGRPALTLTLVFFFLKISLW